MSCLCQADNINYVQILQGATTVTLATTADELLTAGTVQVANNSEAATAFPAAGAVTQTKYTLVPTTPGAY